MRSLLDVNFLIALFDFDHPFHDPAIAWWKSNYQHGWASCPLTENGVVRIMSHVNYREDVTYTAEEVIQSLVEFATKADHEFWPDLISLRNRSLFKSNALRSGSLTDIYLLGLAVQNNGRLVTFDRHIDLAHVTGAHPQHLESVETTT